MVMGNEVLHHHSPNEYPKPEEATERYVRVKEHTIARVLRALDGEPQLLPPPRSSNLNGLSAADVFCGYLLLDVLISNQDRHHENWAILLDSNSSNRFLCPTYDHAACLGRELCDAERNERIYTKDRNRQVRMFVSKARSELFKLKTDKKPLLTIDAFYRAVDKREQARRHWLSKLRNLTDEKILEILSGIPDDVISEPARYFAHQMLLANKERVLNDERA